jgi:hypothetical protein
MHKRSALVIALVAASALALPATAGAVTIQVANTKDSGPGSLRAAINLANGISGFDRIVIGATGAIQAKTPLPGLKTNLAIEGPGASLLSVGGGCATSDCFVSNYPLPPTLNVVAGADVTVRNISITVGPCAGGGGFFSCEQDAVGNAGTLFLGRVLVHDSGFRGITNGGTLTVSRSRVRDNISGIGNVAGGSTTVRQTTISGSYGQAAVFNDAGKLLVSQSSITNNGGEIVNNDDLKLRLTTISNSGPIRNYQGDVAVVQSTVVDGDDLAIWNDDFEGPAGTVTVKSTILDAGSCQRGDVTSLDYNLSPDTGSCNLTATGDKPNTEPGLGPLGFHGGPTKTFAPLATSPAVDAGLAGSTAEDQRGLPRIVDYPGVAKAAGGDNSDIGAVELQGP